MTPDLYPLRLEPSFSRRPWGGGRLPEMLGRPSPEGAAADPVGESWMVYRDNRVTNGAFAGETLGDVAARQGAALLGSRSVARYGAQVPLLSKFIDAAGSLSVQVHPDDAYASEHERGSGHLGKSEAWFVLRATPDAAVLWGFAHDQTPATVRAAIRDGSLISLMNRLPVKAGDVIHNPAGTVHAILAGVLLFEIQQSSDLTYRLYDHGRLGADGRPRPLHVEEALAVADLRGGDARRGHGGRVAPIQLSDGWVRRVLDPHFVMDSVVLPGAGPRAAASSRASRATVVATTSPESMQILQALTDSVVLRWQGGEMPLGLGTSVVLPAALGAYELWADGAAAPRSGPATDTAGAIAVLRCAVVPPPLAAR